MWQFREEYNRFTQQSLLTVTTKFFYNKILKVSTKCTKNRCVISAKSYLYQLKTIDLQRQQFMRVLF